MQGDDGAMARVRAHFFSWDDHAWSISSSLASDAIFDANRKDHWRNWDIHQTDVCCPLFNSGLCCLPLFNVLFDEISLDEAIPMDVGIEPYAESL